MKNESTPKVALKKPEIIEKVKLIDGNFNHSEALEILMSLVSHKMDFHRLKNFSWEERYGIPNENSVKRLTELQRDRERLLEVIAFAEEHNFNISIQSSIQIQLSEK